MKKLTNLVKKSSEALKLRKQLIHFTDSELKNTEELIKTMGEIRQKKLDQRASNTRMAEETSKIFSEKKVVSPNSASKLREGYEKGKAEAKAKKRKLN